jgi:transcriptional regulator with XRE-family HTH domain
MTASPNLLRDVERKRSLERLTQTALAARLEISQAHYSKVVGGIVPLSSSLAARMAEWLGPDAKSPAISRRFDEIDELARSIRADARRLSQLIKAASG